MAVDTEGGIYILAKIDVQSLEDAESVREIRDFLDDNPVFGNSVLGGDIEKRSEIVARLMSNTDVEADARQDAEVGARQDATAFDRVFGQTGKDEVVWMRIFTTIVLLFLTRILIQVYRYNMRLAAYWESRADAMLLFSTFAQEGVWGFDDLVNVLSPDHYDFKPAPAVNLDVLKKSS